ILNNDLGGVVAIDTGQHKTPTQFIPVGMISDNIAVTPDGAFLYVVSEDLGGVGKIDAKTGEIKAVVLINLGLYSALAISPDGAFVYAGSATGIVVINAMTDRTVTTVTLTPASSEPFGIAFSFNSAVAYASVPDDSVLVVLDAKAHRVINSIPV